MGISFLLGVIFSTLIYRLLVLRNIKHLKQRSQSLVSEAQEKAKFRQEDIERQMAEYKEETFQELEKQLDSLKEVIEEKKIQIQEKSTEHKHVFKIEEKKCLRREENTNQIEVHLENKKKHYKEKKQKLLEAEKKYIKLLEEQVEQPFDNITKQITEKLKHDFKEFVIKKIQKREDRFRVKLDEIVKNIILRVIHRFVIPYCPERAIPSIGIKDEKIVEKVLGPQQQHIPIMENLIGVDISLSKERDKTTLNVSAFDTVRRELTRLVCVQLIKDKKVNQERVRRLVERKKHKLLKKIKSDGVAMAQKLNLKNVHPEVMKLMGCLRYRYSFAQNQYFHCGEVGWLCGLFSEELYLDRQKGRRAGWLHDLGKSMDHSLSGGHAVIGADFIEKYGEQEDIVHAVKAHHYDVEPATPLSFLVIAADALSGSRPGARRSTAESYTQKLEQLYEVTKEFEDVIETTLILSGAKELRIYVDSQKINDHKALEMSTHIASKIENELSYPGHIKVTIVRQAASVHISNAKAQ